MTDLAKLRELLEKATAYNSLASDELEFIDALRNSAEELIAAAERNGVLEAALRDSDCQDGGNVGKCVDNDVCTCQMRELLGDSK